MYLGNISFMFEEKTLPLQSSIFQLSLKRALKQNTRHYTYLGQPFTCMIYCM
jgi:hypothetical protein